MTSPCLLFAFVCVACPPSVSPVPDLTKIDRTIAREPAYRSKAREYCLLVFGPEAKTRVWLVLDGDRLYVDRNGNGDLTEEGEWVKADSKRAVIDSITEAGGKAKHLRLEIRLAKREDGAKALESVSVETRGTFKEYSFIHKPAYRPHDAQVVHFSGPLGITFSATLELARGDSQAWSASWLARWSQGRRSTIATP